LVMELGTCDFANFSAQIVRRGANMHCLVKILEANQTTPTYNTHDHFFDRVT
jgi:hypothetical protein